VRNGDQMFDLRQIWYGFVGNLVFTLFAGICTTLGFGPTRWVEFLITGMPAFATPGVVRLIFLLLASLTLISLLWQKIVAGQFLVKITSIAFASLPFVVGAFYVNGIDPDRHLTHAQRVTLSQEMTKIKASLSNFEVASVSDREAMTYAANLIQFFVYLNLPVVKHYGDPPTNHFLIPLIVTHYGTPEGMAIAVSERDNPPTSAKLFLSAMQNAGFKINYETFSGQIPSEFVLVIDYAHK
jgi:hypothetical protein